jgi:hypothetical protein
MIVTKVVVLNVRRVSQSAPIAESAHLKNRAGHQRGPTRSASSARLLLGAPLLAFEGHELVLAGPGTRQRSGSMYVTDPRHRREPEERGLDFGLDRIPVALLAEARGRSCTCWEHPVPQIPSRVLAA